MIWDRIRERLRSYASSPPVKRSSKWRKVRAEHIEMQPVCELCGATTKLEVHHVFPFSFAPELYLDHNNLMTLCDGNGSFGIQSCHRFFGHLGNWRNFNPNVKDDVYIWARKLGVSKS